MIYESQIQIRLNLATRSWVQNKNHVESLFYAIQCLKSLLDIASLVNLNLSIPIPMTITITPFLTFHSFTIRTDIFPPKMIRTHEIISNCN